MGQLKIIVVEGAYYSGKSSVCLELKKRVKNSSLFCFTGTSDDYKDTDVYLFRRWISTLEHLEDLMEDQEHSKSNHTIICDRFFYSEMVCNPLYKKNYDFKRKGKILHKYFLELNPKVFVITQQKDIFEIRIGNDSREGKINTISAPYTLEESLKQNEGYIKLAEEYNLVRLHNRDKETIVNIILKDLEV